MPSLSSTLDRRSAIRRGRIGEVAASLAPRAGLACGVDLAMLHPDTELRLVDTRIGYGVFATAPIPAGTVTWVLDRLDILLSSSLLDELDPVMAEMVVKYSWRWPDARRVLAWDFCRFMNHSCVPTCVSADLDFEVAVTDIQPGEQLTNDYASLNLERTFECQCGHAECRGLVAPDDFDGLCDEWDRRIASALSIASRVAQPLLPMSVESGRLEQRLGGTWQPPSFRERRFGSPQGDVAPTSSVT